MSIDTRARCSCPPPDNPYDSPHRPNCKLSIHPDQPFSLAVDDPRKIVRVVASDGKTGDVKDLVYTNCKVIGNGSFGIVFQAKLIDESEGNSEIAIKKVLQDKRFKVRPVSMICADCALRPTRSLMSRLPPEP